MFFISSAIYFLGNTLFVVFGKSDIQPWNEPKKKVFEVVADNYTNFGTFEI